MATPVLLHSCCGPCSTYTVVRLREQSLEPTALWYNPNIHPFIEHNQRLEAMQSFAERAEVPLVIVEGYEFIRFLRLMSGHEGDRCADCYRLRLGRAAAEAHQRGFPVFSTTLLISPFQDHERLREVGQEVAREHSVEFYYEDLRPGFPESRRLAKELGLYRQQYCGCIYSEWERYAKAKVGNDGFHWA